MAKEGMERMMEEERLKALDREADNEREQQREQRRLKQMQRDQIWELKEREVEVGYVWEYSCVHGKELFTFLRLEQLGR